MGGGAVRRWVIDARDANARLIAQDDALYLPARQGAADAIVIAHDRWPDAYRVRAYLWQDDRDDWEILNPGE